MDLNISAEDLNKCVQCGLCLPSCPTYRVTGQETHSPRGRIALMREVQAGNALLSEEITEAFESCVQCRGCEPACPSQVPYGRLIEATRTAITSQPGAKHALKRTALKAALAQLERPSLLQASTQLLKAAQRIGPLAKAMPVPRVSPQKIELTNSGTDVILFSGCVMDVWQREVHLATQQVLEAAGFGVTISGQKLACCGALSSHQGLADQAKAMAQNVIKGIGELEEEYDIPAGRPLLVNSAGCGAALKEYGHLLGTDQAHKFSERVFDVHEFLLEHIDALPTPKPDGDAEDVRVVVQDPCHLRHVQKQHTAVHRLLGRYYKHVVEIPDGGLCCGAGGAYSVMQPELAEQMRSRKIESINKLKPHYLASANPGCSMFLEEGLLEQNQQERSGEDTAANSSKVPAHRAALGEAHSVMRGVKVLHPMVLLKQRIVP